MNRTYTPERGSGSRPAVKFLWARAAAVVLVLGYWLLALAYVDRAPPVHEDEPWIASTGWELAARGRFASRMFAGLDGMDRNYYEFMPLYPVAQSFLFRGAGIGLFQARFVSVMAGALTLCLTIALGSRLFDARAGLLGGLYLPTGILFVDVNRLARYDTFVPLFGLLALHLFIGGRGRARPLWFLAAGAASGLAGLAHVYGVFWAVALLILALWERERWRIFLMLVAGAALPWLGYLAFVLSDLASWRAQLEWNAGRVDPTNLMWYVRNVSTEGLRYDIGELLPLSPGAWFASVGLAAAAGALALGARGVKRFAARVVLAPLIVQLLLLALFVNKLPNYALTLAPLVAVILAWGIVQFYDAVRIHVSSWLARGAVALLLAAGAAESAARVLAFYPSAAHVLAYAEIAPQLRGSIAPGSRVLGLHSSWFGFEDTDYRDILVLRYFARETGNDVPAVLRALDAFAPQAIVIDPRLDAYLNNADSAESFPPGLRAWIEQNGFHSVAQVSVPEGTYRVYEGAP